MRDSFVFDLVDKHRGRLLQLVEGCPVEKRNVVPAGFNNSVHWQIGHVLTVTERVIFGFAEQPTAVPASYMGFFGSGTKPADWQEEPPAWDDLVAQLKDQAVRIRETFKDTLGSTVKENFFKAETVEELIVSSMLHEVNHGGVVASLLKVLK
ncbi:hypothetical protein A8709_06225 [Paenibacillus pectinilyticus]|uniref:DinB-like domain-containing protein n=1 Tax=Paenibacillus pectinilyticus TaxID=512399 RepID=A0A1C0ZT59_9BACL|nr:DinB family protein [Paenibacillus pectinilyticus]OCT11269.1 hypothetical protein A8709_06225 [Paenibacillus pectinilyticus]